MKISSLTPAKVVRHLKWRIMHDYRIELDLGIEEKRFSGFAKYLINKQFGTREYCRFIVMTQARTGSNMLMTFLDSHPDVYVRGEMFSRVRSSTIDELVKSQFDKQPKWAKAVGCKLFFLHPYDIKPELLWERLAELDFKFIFLNRRNKLEQFYSKSKAELNQEWFSSQRGQKNKVTTIEVDPEELKKYVRQQNAERVRFSTYFPDAPYIDLFYEDLVADTPKEFRKITDFIGVKPHTPKTNLKKQNKRPMRDVITNYDALKAQFAGTDLAELFEE